MMLAVIMTLIMDGVLLVAGDFLMSMFTSDAAVREIGSSFCILWFRRS